MEKYHTVVTIPKSYRKFIERGKIYSILFKDITADLLGLIQALRIASFKGQTSPLNEMMCSHASVFYMPTLTEIIGFHFDYILL